MDSYEECRGPPRLFLLDKFDVAGAGACLKRFTDPSFFKMGSASTGGKLERQREKKNRKIKKRGAHLKNGEPPESFPSSHAKLHQLFLEERVESGGNDLDRRVKLKKRQFTGALFDQENTKSYMEKFLDTCPPEQRIVHEIYDPLPLTWTSNNASESSLEIVEIGTVSPLKESIEYDRGFCSSPDAGDAVVKSSVDEFGGGKSNTRIDSEAVEVLGVNCSSYDNNKPLVVNGGDFANRESKSEDSINNGCDSDDVASEMDGYVDALASIDSEVDTDSDRKKYTSYLNLKPVVVDSDGSLEQRELQGVYLDSQSVGNSATSEDGFRERTNSSCSNSVTAMAEITSDFDTVAVADSSFPVSDNDYTFIADHLESKKIAGSEAKEHDVAYMTDLKVNGGPKVAQEFDNVSDTSCLTDPNTKSLSAGMKTHMIENSLQTDDVYSNSSGDYVPSGETDRRHAFNKIVSTFLDKADSENWSDEHSNHDEAGHISSVFSDTSPVAKDTSASLQIQSHNAHSVCSPFEEHPADTFETPISEGEKHQELHSEDNIADRDSFLEDDAVSTVEVDRTASNGILERDTASHDFTTTSPDQTGAVEMNARLNHSLTEAVDILTGSEFALSGKIEDGNNIFSNDTSLFEVQSDHANDPTALSVVEDDADSDFDAENLDPIGAVACSRSANPEDDHGKKDDPLSSLTVHPEQLQDKLLLVSEEDNLSREEPTKVPAELTDNKHINSVPDALVDLNLDLCNTSTAVSSPVSPHSMVLQDIENSGKFVVDTPLASENSFQSVESASSSQLHLLEAKDDNNDLSIEHDISSAQDNLGKDVQTREYVESGGYIASTATSYSQNEPFVSIPLSQSAPSEYQNNLEAPPLPPLPPMQWRLGRFRNFTSAPERHSVQEQSSRVQFQPTHLLGMHHAHGPGLTMDLPTVHYTLAPVQPAVLPAVHHTLIPVPQMPIPTLENQAVSIAQTSRIEGSSDGYVVLPGGIAMPIVATGSQGYSQSDVSLVGGKEHLIFSVPSTSGYMPLQGGSIMPIPAAVYDGSQDNRSFFATSTSIPSQSSTHISENFHQPYVGPLESGSSNDGPAPEHNLVVAEATENDDAGDPDDLLVPKMTEQETMSSSVQIQPSGGFVASEAERTWLSTHDGTQTHTSGGFVASEAERTWLTTYDGIQTQTSGGFVASEAERTWLSSYDGIQTHTGSNTNGSLQKKLPRPRNPLIDEVVAIDKSKLRKVERVKPSLDSKAEEMESLFEQMQLRKVEKVKQPTETKDAEERYRMEHLQLRKVGERAKPLAEPKHDESEFLPEQLQLRKVGERFKAEVEHKAEETQSPRVQLRKLSERVKPEVVPKTEETESPRIQLRKVSERVKQEIEARTEETDSPRVQLRKVGDNSQALVAPKAEERDSLLEQIRNKSFSLKPAVAARPNIQGPRTNLKVAAILEKASNIRQAMAGSDEDDDADTWE
ncbi:hypothetical protein RND81_01G027000 [Saponaria officinalis]